MCSTVRRTLDPMSDVFRESVKIISETNSPRYICSSNGSHIKDPIKGSSVNLSTSRRRERMAKSKRGKTSSTERSHAPKKSHDNKGRWGFNYTMGGFPKDTPRYKGKTCITETTSDTENIIPHLAYYILTVEMSDIKMQKFIDKANTKIYGEDDPHICSKEHPCKNHLLRTDATGKLDCESGTHMCAIKASSILSKDCFDESSIVVPSWHEELNEKWMRERGPANRFHPLCSFDASMLSKDSVQTYIAEKLASTTDDVDLYIIANIFGGDHPEKDGRRYDISIQLIRGNIETEDQNKAGFGRVFKNIPNEILKESARVAACREMTEETDGVLIETEKLKKNMKVIYDFQQYNTVKQTVSRGIVFGNKDMVNPYDILDYTRLQS